MSQSRASKEEVKKRELVSVQLSTSGRKDRVGLTAAHHFRRQPSTISSLVGSVGDRMKVRLSGISAVVMARERHAVNSFGNGEGDRSCRGGEREGIGVIRTRRSEGERDRSYRGRERERRSVGREVQTRRRRRRKRRRTNLGSEVDSLEAE